MRHWGACAVVILIMAACAAALALLGCSGSSFIAAPSSSEPDTSDCGQIERTFTGSAPWTPTPFPFRGTRTASMWAARPEGWEFFDGQVYLMGAEWDVGWISYMRMSLEGTATIAVWDGARWDVDSRVDVVPYIEERGDYLVVKPTFTARGLKPAGRSVIPVRIMLAVCGQGHEFIR